MKIIFSLLMITLILGSQLLAKETELDRLINNALIQNPDLRSLQYKIEAMEAKQKLVRKIMDPMLGIEYSNFPFDSWKLDESPMSGVQFKLQQTITFPGKNGARSKVARSETIQKQFLLEQKQLKLISRIKMSWAKLALINELEAIAREHLQLLSNLKDTATSRYEHGKMKHYDLLRLELMIDKLTEELNDYDQQKKAVTEMLNLATGSNLHINTQPVLTDLNSNLEFDIASFEEIMLQKHPELKRIMEMENQQKLNIKQAKIERIPNPTIWVGYRYRQDLEMAESPDFGTVGISVPIPLELNGKTKHKISIAKSKKMSASLSYQNAVNTLTAQLETAFSDYNRYKSKSNKYRIELLPGADSALESIIAAFSSGSGDFTTVIQAQSQLLDFHKMLIMSQFKAALAEITLNELTGANSEVIEQAGNKRPSGENK